MNPREVDRLGTEIPRLLAGLIGEEGYSARVPRRSDAGFDLEVRTAGRVFAVELKQSSAAAPLAAAVRTIGLKMRKAERNRIPLVVVPFMGEVGRKICEEAGLSWFDLSGNASIVAPGIRIVVKGNRNRFRSAGRPANVFAPKSSRIARWLLMHPEELPTQRSLSRAVGIDEGFVSRIVGRLEAGGYVVRERGPRLRLANPELLLDDWREAYRFEKHTILKGHIAARSGDLLMKALCGALSAEKAEYAVTGLGAAWLYTRFAGFRIVSLYLAGPSTEVLEQVGFSEDARGANVWVVLPNDIGVFHGAVVKDGIRSVHPIQAYLDLKGHPERASEAAERLRETCMKWKQSR